MTTPPTAPRAHAGAPPGSPSLLMIGNFRAPGRNAGACDALAARLRDAGWRVTTASSRRGAMARAVDMAGTAWRARHRYEVAQVDVFSGRAFAWAEGVCFVLRRAGKPYVLTLHGGALPAFARAWPGRVRRLLASAQAVTAPSEYLRAEMRSFRSDVIVVPNGIELEACTYAPRRALRPRLVWLRAFHAIYNPELAVRVVARLAREVPVVTLTMTGPDKGDGSLERTRAAAAQSGVADRVTFHPGIPHSEVPARLAQGDIFLNTTDVDNTPVSVLEAMASGLPVVSTDVGGLPYLLRDGETALLVARNDAKGMARAVARLLAEPALAERLSHAARARAEQCAWPAVVAAWERVLQRAAGAPPAVPSRMMHDTELPHGIAG